MLSEDASPRVTPIDDAPLVRAVMASAARTYSHSTEAPQAAASAEPAHPCQPEYQPEYQPEFRQEYRPEVARARMPAPAKAAKIEIPARRFNEPRAEARAGAAPTPPPRRRVRAAAVPLTLAAAALIAGSNSNYATLAANRVTSLLIPARTAPLCFAEDLPRQSAPRVTSQAALPKGLVKRLSPHIENLRANAEEAALACRDGTCTGNSLALYNNAVSDYFDERLAVTAALERAFGARGTHMAHAYFSAPRDQLIEDSMIATDAHRGLALKARGPSTEAFAILAERGRDAVLPCPAEHTVTASPR